MKVLITGSSGFMGKNLVVRLKEMKNLEIAEFHREVDAQHLPAMVKKSDFIFHLAGINRPKHEEEFITGNAALTETICEAIKTSGRKIPIVYTSSTQTSLGNPYGKSKKKAEAAIEDLARIQPAFYYRLPNVFGKWSRPNYNSAVATFCTNIANDIPIQINNAAAVINLVYIDDVVESFLDLLNKFMTNELPKEFLQEVQPVYKVTVGELAEQIHSFKRSREALEIENLDSGLKRALHSTYLSFLLPSQFAYDLPQSKNDCGKYFEKLKTQNNGQISYCTAPPGGTLGGYYYHSKTEKFLVLKGRAEHKFRHILTDQICEIISEEHQAQIIESIPGWTHNITNTGNDELIVMVWSNESRDQRKPAAIAHEV